MRLILLSLALLFGGTAAAQEKVFVGNGYYDLATPYFATAYTFDHLAFDPGFAERVTQAYCECGHMMYIRKPDREKLKRDLAAFYRAAGG